VPHAGQEIIGQEGFRLRLVRTGAETGGEVLEMEATYGGSGRFPPKHFHPRQVERFEVLEGAIRALIRGGERVYGPGEVFEVPAGTPHTMTADEPTRMRWEVRPALRTAEFFERLYGEGPGSLQAAGSFEEFASNFTEEFRLARP
jgi:quercetin dioxygenase-like cupin family protein